MKNGNRKFTERQLKHFKSYEMVRESGIYNMFSPQARIASCLSKEDYIFVMNNYEELQKQAEEASCDSINKHL